MIIDTLQTLAVSLYTITLGSLDVSVKDSLREEIIATKVEIIETGVRENSGIEQIGEDIISVDDSGVVYKNGQKVLEIDADLEGIAYCEQKYYLIKERADEIVLYNEDFHFMGAINYAKKIPRAGDMKNAEIEGIACASDGVYLSGVGTTIWHIDHYGDVVGKIQTSYTKIAALDTHEDSEFLYALSDDSDIIMVIDKKRETVTKEIPIPQIGQWEALDVRGDTIRIAKDDEDTM